MGFIDGSRNKELHKASYVLEEFEKSEPFEIVNKYLESENPKEALAQIKKIESNVETINNLVNVSSFAVIIKHMQELKTASTAFISLPKTNKIMSVFNSKLDNFSSYVEKNNWRTLTRMSSRVNSLTNKALERKEYDRFVEKIKSEFSQMISITEKSILKSSDKSEIINRISNLNTEVAILNKHVEKRKILKNIISLNEKSLSRWISEVTPEFSLQKIKVEQMGRYYLMGTFFILLVNVALFFIGIFARKIFISKAQNSLEIEIERVITEELISKETVELLNYSDEFKSKIDKHSKYINKRMSFGTIFQESLPFSSMMLDKNLKVEWANKRFLEEWALNEEDLVSYDLSWDYLSKLTNIGHNDPVLDALKNQIAGIYQVQLKINSNAPVQPYEMFVSPLKNEGDTKIMLFFYPLSSLQETIQDQAMSILNPINKTLNLIEEDKFYENEFEQLEKEFEIGSITHIFSRFKDFVDKFRSRENRLIDEIEVLNGKLEHTSNLFNNITQDTSVLEENTSKQIKSLKVFKKSAIGLSSLTHDLVERSGETHKLVSSLSKGIEEARVDLDSANERVSEFSGILPKLNDIKEKIKYQKNQVSNLRLKINGELSSLERENNPHQLKKVIDDFSTFNSESISLEKNIIQLEILISKSQMLLHSQKSIQERFDSTNLNSQLTIYNNFIKEIDSINSQLETFEAQMVEGLTDLYTSVSENGEKQLSLRSNLPGSELAMS